MKEENILKLVLVVVLILSVLPWLQNGVPFTDDLRAHVAHTWNMKNNIENDRWPFTAPMLEIYSGWPIWEFYSLTPYVMTLPFVFMFEAVGALKASIIFSFLVAIISMYFACNLLFKDTKVSVVASVAYTYFGYHFINAGSRGAFNELWGYSLFPIAVALFINTIKNPNKNNIIYTILGTAIMVITHIPTAWLLGMVYLCYIIYDMYTKKGITLSLIKICSVVLIGSILLTVFSLGPLYTESKKVNFEELGGTSIIGFTTPGLSLTQLFERGFGNMPDGQRYFYIGYILILLSGFAFINVKESRFYIYVTIGTILVMLFPFVLYIVPLASVLQFIFRLLIIVGFCLSITAGLSVKGFKFEKPLLGVLAIIALILLDFWGANSFQMTGQPTENFINPSTEIDAFKIISYDPDYFLVFAPFAQADYMYTGHWQLGFDWAGYRQGASGLIHKEYTDTAKTFINDLQTNNINDLINQSQKLGYYGVKYITLPCGSTIESFIKPEYSNGQFCNYINPYFSKLIISEYGSVSDEKFDIDKISFMVNNNQTSKVLVKIFNFKGHWTATEDGKEIGIWTSYPEYILLQGISEGQHNIEIVYHSTLLQKLTLWISLLTLIGLLYVRFKK